MLYCLCHVVYVALLIPYILCYTAYVRYFMLCCVCQVFRQAHAGDQDESGPPWPGACCHEGSGSPT